MERTSEARETGGSTERSDVLLGSAGGGAKSRARIRVVEYDESRVVERLDEVPEDCLPEKGRSTVTWVDVDGLDDVTTLDRLGKVFDLHPLVVHDIALTSRRPKFEDYGEYAYVSARLLSYVSAQGVVARQVGLILGRGFVLTIQGRGGDAFAPLRARLKSGERLRRMGPDYLAYALLDLMVDGYLAIVERLGEEVEVVEDRLLKAPRPESLRRVHRLRRELIALRKSVWPLREVVGALGRGGCPLVADSTLPYFRDLYDHDVEAIDTIETQREILTGLLDLYLSGTSNRLNEVMKVLTVISTVFMPLTFIVGIYGMNFEYMPELKSPLGYPLVLGLMAVIALAMLRYFRGKGWI